MRQLRSLAPIALAVAALAAACSDRPTTVATDGDASATREHGRYQEYLSVRARVRGIFDETTRALAALGPVDMARRIDRDERCEPEATSGLVMHYIAAELAVEGHDGRELLDPAWTRWQQIGLVQEGTPLEVETGVSAYLPYDSEPGIGGDFGASIDVRTEGYAGDLKDKRPHLYVFVRTPCVEDPEPDNWFDLDRERPIPDDATPLE